MYIWYAVLHSGIKDKYWYSIYIRTIHQKIETYNIKNTSSDSFHIKTCRFVRVFPARGGKTAVMASTLSRPTVKKRHASCGDHLWEKTPPWLHLCRVVIHMGVSYKMLGLPPKSSHFKRLFHCFHHPFWGTPIFGNTHIRIYRYDTSYRYNDIPIYLWNLDIHDLWYDLISSIWLNTPLSQLLLGSLDIGGFNFRLFGQYESYMIVFEFHPFDRILRMVKSSVNENLQHRAMSKQL